MMYDGGLARENIKPLDLMHDFNDTIFGKYLRNDEGVSQSA